MKNKTTSITDFSQLVKELNESGIKNNVAVVWAEDSHTIYAVEMAYKAGVINPILVCSEQTAERFKNIYETLLADNPQDASEKAVELVRQGKADALMKGFVNTDVLLRAILNKEKGILPKGSVLTHITAAKIPTYPKLLFFTDPAVLPFPTHEQRIEQIKYVANFCHAFNIEQPKISLIHCSEKPDGKHFPYTEGYLELKKWQTRGLLETV